MFKNILLVAFTLLIGTNVNAQTQGKRAGFDLIGIGSGYQYAVGNIFGPWVGAQFPSVIDTAAGAATADVTAVPFDTLSKRVKITKVSAVYFSAGNQMLLSGRSALQGWQVDIWGSQNQVINNPWIGNVRSEILWQPTGGSAVTPIQTLGIGNKYYLEFDIQDIVLDRQFLKQVGSNGVVYIGVRAIHDSVVNPGWGGIVESSYNSPQYVGTGSFDYSSIFLGTGWATTTAMSPSSTFGNPAYAVEAYRCVNQTIGAPC